MTDTELITQFDEMGFNDLSATLKIQLASNAKNKLERDLRLAICTELDESNSTSVGQTYATAITLPTGFRGLAEDYIWIGDSQCFPKPFTQAPRWRSSNGFFYINHKNNQYHLTGTQNEAATIAFPYIVKTDDITSASIAADETTITWPSDFHSIIPYEMVKQLFAIDAADKGRSWMPEWTVIYNELKSSLINWDAAIKLSAIGGVTPYGDNSPGDSPDRINF